MVVYHGIFNIVPCALQQDFAVYPWIWGFPLVLKGFFFFFFGLDVGPSGLKDPEL